MASEATIQFNYNRAISQARKLEQLADELKSLANSNLESTISNLSSNWNGESATAFIAKAQKAKDDMLNNATQLYNTASVVRKSAKNIRDAELQALKVVEFVKNRS